MSNQNIDDMIRHSIQPNSTRSDTSIRPIIDVESRDRLSRPRDVRIYFSQTLSKDRQHVAIGKIWEFLRQRDFLVPFDRNDMVTPTDIAAVFYTQDRREPIIESWITIRCRTCTIGDEVLDTLNHSFDNRLNNIVRINLVDHAQTYFDGKLTPTESSPVCAVGAPILHLYYVIVELSFQSKTIQKVARLITDFLMDNDPGPDGADNEVKTEIIQSGRGFHKTHIVKVFCHNLDEVKAIADLLRPAPWLKALGLIKVSLWKPMGEK